MRSYKAMLLAGLVSLMPTMAFAADSLTDAQKTEVEAIVRELLTKKEPEIVMKAAQSIQERVDAENEVKSNEAITKNAEKINNDPTSQVGGNPKGDVTVVEFFDYGCGYCKAVQESVEKALADDKNIRFVYKELPILGPNSVKAAKAALASVSQGKYIKFHNALMTSKEQLTEPTIMKLAKGVGLDTDKLKKDMEDDKINKIIKSNLDLAKELGAHGTPTFVINNKLFPGALPAEDLKKAVAEARAEAKKKK